MQFITRNWRNNVVTGALMESHSERQPRTFTNVFVLCTGRSGSLAVERACSHIDNYTVGHESRTRLVGHEKLAYPESHIEVDNRLAWHLGRLEHIYGDNAFYVFLRRNREAVIESYHRRWGHLNSLVTAYAHGILMRRPSNNDVTVTADLIDTIQCNIESFMRNRRHKLVLDLERIEETFPLFWEAIGAEGDLAAALREFAVPHNASRSSNFRDMARRLRNAWVSAVFWLRTGADH